MIAYWLRHGRNYCPAQDEQGPEERQDASRSRLIARVYLIYWGTHIERKLQALDPSFKLGPQHLCAIWPWGPGWRPWKSTRLDRNRTQKLLRIMADLRDISPPKGR